MMDRLRTLLAGRNGFDQLAAAAIICAVLLNLLGRVLGGVFFPLLALAALSYGFFRVFSGNVAARREENRRFMAIKGDALAAWRGWRTRRAQSRQFKFFTCPGCKNKLRVPRGKGSVQITCPRCGQRFSGRT